MNPDILIQRELRAQKMLQLAEQNKQRTTALEGTDLRDIPFPNVEHYGHNHAQETSQLAYYIGQMLGLSDADLTLVKTAALLHDLGRETPWMIEDPYHNVRSAELATRWLRGQEQHWFRSEFIDEVGALISKHSLTSKTLPSDPRLQALWDAEAYEAARLAPGETEGLKIFRARTASDRLCSDWAKDVANKRTWLTHRGWK